MGDIFNLDTTAFLIVHFGAFLAVGAVIVMLYQAYECLKREKETTTAIRIELNKLKSELLAAARDRREVEQSIHEFEEENTRIRNLKKEIENYKQQLLAQKGNGKKYNGKN